MTSVSLEIANARLAYGPHVVCDDLSYRLPQGKFTAILGPNGCGKSTLLRAFARALKPTAGQVLLGGKNLYHLRPKQVAQTIALLPQHPIAPPSMRVKDLVARGRHPYHSPLRQWGAGDSEAINQALEETSLGALAEQMVVKLSGGQRQRAWIAMVLAQETDYILLDEPTSFLDIAYQLDVLELAAKIVAGGRSVVAVLHDVSQAARYADNLVVMHAGNIVAAGAPDEVLTAKLLAEVFGIEATVRGSEVTVLGRKNPED